ncbi:DUF1592 domain-containing protein, partial [Akkermansiaceae bacterium]|nr:DUF1592 domain-containing protein [Akkermansiaceae bacterium]
MFLGKGALCLGLGSLLHAEEPEPVFVMHPKAEELLDFHCYSCHEEGEEKGDIRLDNMSELSTSARLDLFNKMQEQVYLGEMPPKKKEQPTSREQKALLSWLSGELKVHNAYTLEDKIRYPEYGNYVDHTKLFSGAIQEKAYTPVRRFLVSPQIFIERVNAVFKLQGRGKQRSFYGVTNPIILPDHAGVRYYDNGILDGGHLLMMLTNADWISAKQIRPARVKKGELKAKEYANPKDKWSPPKTPDAFEKIILKDSEPSESEMEFAIHAQFDCVLQRDATEGELRDHLKLLKSSIELGGNTEGLRQMLMSVLLKSEFMYRQEFGSGTVDAVGRKMLSPREASYAISYALSDGNPDPVLVKAAESGQLESREDFHREVTRLLEDEKMFLAEGAPSLNGKNLRSHQVTHPKVNRFFREFFGYPNMVKVFKDIKRSDGFYQNAGRGTAGTAGQVINEADKMVDHILRADRNVFEELLTSDKFFVYHSRPNEEAEEIIEGWRMVYEKLKNTDWKNKEEEISLQYKDLVEKYLKVKLSNRQRARG